MSVQIREDLTGMDAASAELDRLIAEDSQAGTSESAEATKTPEESANDGNPDPDGKSGSDRAAQTPDRNAQGQFSKQKTEAGTPSAADQAKLGTKTAEKSAEGESKNDDKTKDQGKAQSRFEKDRERRVGTWTEINAQKDALKKEREEFERSRTEFQQMLDETEQGFSAEQFEAAARKFEEAGKLDLAEAARDKAKQLRENPDPKAASRKARMDARKKQTEDQTKEWTLKAGVDFPELAKDKSPLQLRVAELFREEPDLKAHPKGIYVAARIASLEAAAASVPEKDKELAQLRAKVKGLEEATSPGGEGGPTTLPADKPFEQMSGDEQLASLEREAQALGAYR